MGMPLYHKDDNDATDHDNNDEDDGYSLQKVRCTDWRKLICQYYQWLWQNIFFFHRDLDIKMMMTIMITGQVWQEFAPFFCTRRSSPVWWDRPHSAPPGSSPAPALCRGFPIWRKVGCFRRWSSFSHRRAGSPPACSARTESASPPSQEPTLEINFFEI